MALNLCEHESASMNFIFKEVVAKLISEMFLIKILCNKRVLWFTQTCLCWSVTSRGMNKVQTGNGEIVAVWLSILRFIVMFADCRESLTTFFNRERDTNFHKTLRIIFK